MYPCNVYYYSYEENKFLIIIQLHINIEIAEAGATFGAVLEATESKKHQANDEKCSALGWVSTPLAVDSYGAWGKEASLFLAQVAARLAIHKSLLKSQASFDLFSNLSICLIRANARAILRSV